MATKLSPDDVQTPKLGVIRHTKNHVARQNNYLEYFNLGPAKLEHQMNNQKIILQYIFQYLHLSIVHLQNDYGPPQQ